MFSVIPERTFPCQSVRTHWRQADQSYGTPRPQGRSKVKLPDEGKQKKKTHSSQTRTLFLSQRYPCSVSNTQVNFAYELRIKSICLLLKLELKQSVKIPVNRDQTQWAQQKKKDHHPFHYQRFPPFQHYLWKCTKSNIKQQIVGQKWTTKVAQPSYLSFFF